MSKNNSWIRPPDLVFIAAIHSGRKFFDYMINFRTLFSILWKSTHYRNYSILYVPFFSFGSYLIGILWQNKFVVFRLSTSTDVIVLYYFPMFWGVWILYNWTILSNFVSLFCPILYCYENINVLVSFIFLLFYRKLQYKKQVIYHLK